MRYIGHRIVSHSNRARAASAVDEGASGREPCFGLEPGFDEGGRLALPQDFGTDGNIPSRRADKGDLGRPERRQRLVFAPNPLIAKRCRKAAVGRPPLGPPRWHLRVERGAVKRRLSQEFRKSHASHFRPAAAGAKPRRYG